jgi:UDP-glucose 4-epimerase
MNLANARGYSVSELIAIAERKTEQRIRVNIAPPRPGDPAMLIGTFESRTSNARLEADAI